MRYNTPRISHIVVVLTLYLALFTEGPDGYRDTVIIFLLSDLSIFTCSEEALVARRWDTAFYSSTQTTYSDTASTPQLQTSSSPIVGWEAIVKIIYQWSIFLAIILVPYDQHPVVYDITIILDVVEETNIRLWAQMRSQPDIPEAL